MGQVKGCIRGTERRHAFCSVGRARRTFVRGGRASERWCRVTRAPLAPRAKRAPRCSATRYSADRSRSFRAPAPRQSRYRQSTKLSRCLARSPPNRNCAVRWVRVDVLHFATHALYDPVFLLSSSLILTDGKRAVPLTAEQLFPKADSSPLSSPVSVRDRHGESGCGR